VGRGDGAALFGALVSEGQAGRSERELKRIYDQSPGGYCKKCRHERMARGQILYLVSVAMSLQIKAYELA